MPRAITVDSSVKQSNESLTITGSTIIQRFLQEHFFRRLHAFLLVVSMSYAYVYDICIPRMITMSDDAVLTLEYDSHKKMFEKAKLLAYRATGSITITFSHITF
jgi:uncharacterized membrane protein